MPAIMREPWNFLILVESNKGLSLFAKKRSWSPKRPPHLLLIPQLYFLMLIILCYLFIKSNKSTHCLVANTLWSTVWQIYCQILYFFNVKIVLNGELANINKLMLKFFASKQDHQPIMHIKIYLYPKRQWTSRIELVGQAKLKPYHSVISP